MIQQVANNSQKELEPVIVIGGGPVGLGAALELARCGVRSILIEKAGGTSWHPKTRNFNTRTMEIARGWGRPVYDELGELDLPANWKSPIRFLETISGKETGTIIAEGFAGAGPDLSPVSSVLSSQDMLEPVLLWALKQTGMADLRFKHELVKIIRGAEEDASSVEIEVRNTATDELYTLTGSAMVGADGATSFVREYLEVPMDGPKKVAHFINCYFRADVEKFVGDRTGILLFVANSMSNGVFQPLDAKGRWLVQIMVPEEQWSTDSFTNQHCIDWIRNGVGSQDIEVEILSVGKWQMNAVVGRQLVHGRVLLVGDAAHMFPPTGGLGVNTGMQGMHNAIWKLALYLKGKAGKELFRTYDTERRPVARWVADQSLHNSMQVAKLGAVSRGEASDDEMDSKEILRATRRYGNHLGLELGTVYKSPAIVAGGGEIPHVEDPYTDYIPSGCPGVRAPHVWLDRDGDTISTLDLVEPEFSLITNSMSGEWEEIVEVVGGELGLDLKCHSIGDGLKDIEGTFNKRFGLDEGGAVLVRPDGFIGWRAEKMTPAAAVDLQAALIQILARP